MNSLITVLLASEITAPIPDSGLSSILFASGVLATGLFARFLKNRRK